MQHRAHVPLRPRHRRRPALEQLVLARQAQRAGLANVVNAELGPQFTAPRLEVDQAHEHGFLVPLQAGSKLHGDAGVDALRVAWVANLRVEEAAIVLARSGLAPKAIAGSEGHLQDFPRQLLDVVNDLGRGLIVQAGVGGRILRSHQ